MSTFQLIKIQQLLAAFNSQFNRAMSIGLVLLLISSAAIASPPDRLSIKVENVKISKIFDVIEQKTDYQFLYNVEDVQKAPNVSINISDATVPEILNACFKDYTLKYVIKNKTVVVLAKKTNQENATELSPFIIGIPPIQVTGRVTNQTGEPLEGVSITIKGTTTGTSSDENGNYTISAPDDGTLVFSFVGYVNEEVAINGRSSINLSLKGEAKGLEEVVVVGYTTQNKQDITGSVSVITASDIVNQPSANTEQMLQGKASGLNIISSGAPGAPVNIRIRGISSFGDNSPLVIIDGVQGNLSDIDANDIESISVLKDAGAASIYGVRGANGVIVITSKRGKNEKTRISYNGSYGVTVPFSGNVYNLLNTREMAQATWQAYKNAGQVGANGNPTHPQYGNGPEPVIPDYILVGNTPGVSGDLTQEELNKYNVDYSKGPIYQIVAANKEGTDWYDEISRRAVAQSHNVSLANSNGKSNYYFSLGYLNDEGTTKGTYYTRYNLRANTSFKFKDVITIGENAYFYFRDRPTTYEGVMSTSDTRNPRMNAFLEQPIIPVFDIKGNYAGTRAKGLGHALNPYAVAMENAGFSNSQWGIQGNVFAQVDFLKNFNFRTSFGGTINNNNNFNFQRRTYENAENGQTNIYSQGSSFSRNWTFTNTVEFRKTINRHKLGALAGIESVNYYRTSISGTSAGYFVDDIDFLTLSSGAGNYTNSSSKNNTTLFSQFGKIDYTFNDRYLIETTVRRDGSSRFSEARRWGIFPAISVGWRLSKEGFMENIDWISNMMIKGSWGKLGNEINVDPSNAYTQYSSGIQSSYYDINGTISNPAMGYRLSRIGSNTTGWEEDILTNIGLNFSLFNNKLDFTVEHYKKKVNGLLFTDQAPATVGGATLPTINIGDIENSGIDFNLNYQVTKKDLSLDFGLNVTSYKSKVLRVPGGFFEDGNTRTGNFVRNQEGHPVGAFFGYEIERLFRDTADVSKSPQQDGAAPGRFKYADNNGDGKINAADRTFIGDPNPDFTYGFNFNLSYKDFGLSLFFYGSQGNDVVNYQKWWTDFFPSFQGVKSKNLLYNSWTPENLDAKTPINENISNFSNNAVPNSYYIEDGSFLKLKNVMLSYNFQNNSLTRIGVKNLKAFVQVRNLFTITKYTGLDPEIGGSSSAFGIDWGNYPNNERSYNLGLSFDLN